MLSRAVEMENLDKIEVCLKVESSFLRSSLCLSTSPSSPFFSFFFLTVLSLLLHVGFLESW